MFRFLVIAALVPAMVFGLSNPQVCLSRAPLPTEARVSGCATAPCVLVTGTTKVVELGFVATSGLVAPRATLFGEALGMTGEFEVPEDQAYVCNRLSTGACPLNNGENATYVMDMFFDEDFPEVQMVLEISINNDAGVPITCFRFPAQTVWP